MNNHLKKVALSACIASLSFGTLGQSALASGKITYEVSVTNLTNNVTFTPILGITHTRALSLFELGEPASVALEALAEDGNPAELIASFSDIPRVTTKVATAAGTPADDPLTAAGETATFLITAKRNTWRFSMSAMLLPTNDSFVALNSVRLPRRGSVTYYATGFDAGTELNDQLCVNIPGPKCGGAGFDKARNDRGDFVHISSGINDTGDLTSADYDWRNPVAAITITRVHH